ncbi:MAG TPA: type II secretion system minor pseudopilin GspK [Gammaproteobacteria bacterium]|nr:type II secretion system minor pseudopilin GspK [Gammaproteobacteria bacterium]
MHIRHGTGNTPQQGVALVTALLVVALATVASVGMATRLHVDVRRSANLIHGEQSYAYALAAESWAQVILRRDANDSTYDALDEDWASALPPIPVEGGFVSGHVSDLQGRFNVNNLVGVDGRPDTGSIDYFKRLLTLLELDPELATTLLDWIDADINATFPGGAEDDTYLLADPPYRAANRRLVSISELRLVQGFTDDVMKVLTPYVTALPDVTTININTATAEVLLALHENMTAQGVEMLLADREQEPFADKSAFLAHDALAGLGIEPGSVDVSSHWFLVLTDVSVGVGKAQLESVLERDDKNLRVVSRTRLTAFIQPGG